MYGNLIAQRLKFSISLRHLFLALSIIFMFTAGCADNTAAPEPDDSFTTVADTGATAFSIRWHRTDAVSPGARAMGKSAIEDCSAVGVASITCNVYDQDHQLIASGGPWSCKDREGYMSRIPAGANRIFVIFGWDAEVEGRIIYRGQTVNDIRAGELSDTDTIDAYAFVPQGLTVRVVSGTRIELNWEDLNADHYGIVRNGEEITPHDGLKFEDRDLTPNTEYCYTVKAYDRFGNGSATSETACATTPAFSQWYRDADGDGHGDPNDSMTADTKPAGYVSNPNDCDDDDRAVYPGAEEIKDDKDNDCDGSVDEPADIYYRDADGDGYGDPQHSTEAATRPAGYVSNPNDCNDSAETVHPDAPETCNNIDDNCDGNTDEGVNTTYYLDSDEDGYGDATRPTQACSAPTGYVANAADCNDLSASIHPNAPETCNGIDDDCDDAIDQGVLNTYYPDGDRDGFGSPDGAVQACSAPEGYVADDTDCHDDRDDIHPEAEEICADRDDNNCDGRINEGCACTSSVSILIGDNDGYGYGADKVPDNGELPASSHPDHDWIFDNREPTEINALDGSSQTDFEADGPTSVNLKFSFCQVPATGFHHASLKIDVSGIEEYLYGPSTLTIDGKDYSESLQNELGGRGSHVTTIDFDARDVALFSDGELIVELVGGKGGNVQKPDSMAFDYFELSIQIKGPMR